MAAKLVLEFFLMAETDVADEVEMEDAFDDIEVRGGRAEDVGAVRRGFVAESTGDLARGSCVGDERVKSSSSTA